MKFTIYQIKETNSFENNMMFLPWRIAGKHFNFDNYKEIYTNDLSNLDVLETDDIELLDAVETDDIELLNIIYKIFNIRHPKDYTGHSLSVSDIVNINNKYYFCDSFGWENITDKIK